MIKTPVTELAHVGLDLSLTGSGFCLKRGNELFMETLKTTPKTAPNDLARLQHIRDTLMDKIPPDIGIVCVEDFFVPHRPQQMNASKGLIMLGTVMRIAMLEAGLSFYIIADTQLKKYATGKGKGPKGIVIREIYKKWGIDADDDNQADACVLAHIAEALYRNPGDLHKYQQDTLDKIQDERPRYNVD
jgi:crossover junction endodeoxyribonuclease RuvC